MGSATYFGENVKIAAVDFAKNCRREVYRLIKSKGGVSREQPAADARGGDVEILNTIGRSIKQQSHDFLGVRSLHCGSSR